MLTTKIIPCPFCKEPNRVVPFLTSVVCRSCNKEFELPDPFIGEVIDGYCITQKLGEGKGGNVYLGLSKKNKKVAVKSLNPIFSSTDMMVKRFFFEADVIKKLEHPYIVEGYEVLDKNKKYFLIQEYVEGSSLEEYVERYGTFSWKDLRPIIQKIAEALAYAHTCQIIHRDIKPSNILLTVEKIPKLTDFGISKSLELSDMNLTEQGQTVGTPKFMAPEICSGRPCSPRTDIYSLGVSLYWLLSKRYPIEGGTTKEILINHILQQVRSLKELILVPLEVSDWVDRMLKKNPEERYASIAELLEALPPELK